MFMQSIAYYPMRVLWDRDSDLCKVCRSVYYTSRTVMYEVEGKNITHLTRVNRSSNSSKTIVPRTIIEALNLRYDDDYLEWRMEMRGRRKVATVRKFRRRSGGQ
jgi:hypothetical protein